MQYQLNIIAVKASRRKPLGTPEPMALATGSQPFSYSLRTLAPSALSKLGCKVAEFVRIQKLVRIPEIVNVFRCLRTSAMSANPSSKSRQSYGSQSKFARRRAFSLVELMVVMIIIGLLSSLVAVQTRSYLIASKQNAARAEIATMVSAIESFYADQSRYPTNDEGIEILTQGTKSFPDGFLKKLPLDPWRNPYEYVSPGANSPFEIVCLGADGREGGEGGDADISSETLDAKSK
jgi:general secretion pathway protein G